MKSVMVTHPYRVNAHELDKLVRALVPGEIKKVILRDGWNINEVVAGGHYINNWRTPDNYVNVTRGPEDRAVIISRTPWFV